MLVCYLFSHLPTPTALRFACSASPTPGCTRAAPGPGPATAASPASNLGLAYGRHSLDAEDGQDDGPHFTGGETEAQRDGLRSDRESCLAQAKVLPLARGAVGSWDSWWGPSQWPEGWCVWQQQLGLLWGPTPTLHAGWRGREGGAAAAGGWLGASSILGWEGPHAGAVSLSLCLFHSLRLSVSLFLSLSFSLSNSLPVSISLSLSISPFLHLAPSGCQGRRLGPLCGIRMPPSPPPACVSGGDHSHSTLYPPLWSLFLLMGDTSRGLGDPEQVSPL